MSGGQAAAKKKIEDKKKSPKNLSNTCITSFFKKSKPGIIASEDESEELSTSSGARLTESDCDPQSHQPDVELDSPLLSDPENNCSTGILIAIEMCSVGE